MESDGPKAKAGGYEERKASLRGAKGAQDGRTTATEASTYPRDAGEWMAKAGGYAEYPQAKKKEGHVVTQHGDWGEGER